MLPWWEKAIIGILGSAITALPPAIQASGATTLENVSEFFFLGKFNIYFIVYVLSVYIVIRLPSKHIFESLITSLGLPAIVNSLALGVVVLGK